MLTWGLVVCSVLGDRLNSFSVVCWVLLDRNPADSRSTRMTSPVVPTHAGLAPSSISWSTMAVGRPPVRCCANVWARIDVVEGGLGKQQQVSGGTFTVVSGMPGALEFQNGHKSWPAG